MLRYRVTITTGPNAGLSSIQEMNEAAALALTARGYHLEAVGRSTIVIVDDEE